MRLMNSAKSGVATQVVTMLGELEAVRFDLLHAERLAKWFSYDPMELFFTSSGLPFPCSRSVFTDFYQQHYKKGSHEFFSVFHSPTKKHIGHFEVKNISSAFYTGTLAHVLLGERDFRKRGLGKNLVQLMVKTAFDYLGLYRIGLSVHVGNIPAVTAYIRGGFIVEGVVREVLEKDGKKFSLYQMGLLKPEWNQQR